MSRLTVTEKEHWKARIENRINKAIALLEAQDSALMPGIKARAELEAHKRLGTAKIKTRLDAIEKEREALATEQSKLEKDMYRQALGEQVVRDQYEYYLKSTFQSLLATRRQHIESELLQESSIGREILKLRDERDGLLDTVWLATSNVQIRELWGRVSQVLGDDATPLQQQILATEISEA